MPSGDQRGAFCGRCRRPDSGPGPALAQVDGARIIPAMLPPLVLLLLAVATVVGGIVLLRLDAFPALLVGALLVSLLALGAPAAKVARVAEIHAPPAGTLANVLA